MFQVLFGALSTRWWSLAAKPFTFLLFEGTQHPKACRGAMSISQGNACLSIPGMQEGMHTEVLCATGYNVHHHSNMPGRQHWQHC